MFKFVYPVISFLVFLPLLFQKKQNKIQALKLPLGFIKSESKTTFAIQNKTNFWHYLAILSWIFMVSAAMRPQWIGEPIFLQREGRDLMITLDLSASMEIEDMKINGDPISRFMLVKKVLSEFIQKREGDRLGLVLFADKPYLQSPLTFDRHSLAIFLAETQLGLVGVKTAIGDALLLSVKKLIDDVNSHKVIILVTDGENTAGTTSPIEAVELLKKANIKLYTIGVGSEELEQRVGLWSKRTINPSEQLDKVEGLFRELSQSTGGDYFRAKSTEELVQIYKQIDQLEPVEIEQKSWKPISELYYIPLSIALFLLLMIIIRKAYE